MASFFERWRARRRLRGEVALWYHSQYAPRLLARTYRVSGVEARRSELVLGALEAEGLVRAGDVREPPLATMDDLLAFHPAEYLARSAEPETLARIFGLEVELVEVDELLLAQRRAVGGTLAAARAAAAGQVRVAVNLGGGFHHAEPEQGSGFCVYNDVGIAIARLRAGGFAEPILIVDLDYHQGNGNTVAFLRDPTVFTYSLHGSVWTHALGVADLGRTLPSGTDDETYLAALEETLPPVFDRHRPALVFFLAGNDVLAGDRLGDFRVTPAGVLRRDRRVADLCEDAGAALVVTLGGGYGTDAWRCTANFVRWLLTGAAYPGRPIPPGVDRRYDRVAARLDPMALQHAGEDLGLREEDVLEDLQPGSLQRGRLLLDYYTPLGVEYALEHYGFLAEIRELGFEDARVEVDPTDRSRQVIRIHARKDGKEHLLVELVLRLRDLRGPFGPSLRMLGVEWLLLQNPTAEFTLDRPRLPGQEHPGLGLAEEVLEMLVQVCRRLDLAGLVHRPAHYHVAYVGAATFRFLDPEVQGRFEAMREVLRDCDLPTASLWLDEGALRLGDGRPVAWETADYARPVGEALVRYFESPAYREAVAAARARLIAEGLHLRRP